MKVNTNVSYWKKLITYDIWYIDESTLKPYKKIPVIVIKILSAAISKFFSDKITIRASALTYFTLMSIVPVIALLFAVAKGFGLDEYLTELLQQQFSNQQETLNLLLGFSKSLLKNAKGGIIVGVGLAFLLWSVMSLLGSIESTLNNIWQIKRNRPYVRKFTDYFSILLIAPIFLIVINGTIIFLSTTVTSTLSSFMSENMVIILKKSLVVLPYVLLMILFTLLYMILPYTKVKIKPALVAALVAAIGYNLILQFYVYSQVTVSKYSAIYGSFAALPLFLLMTQISWMIILFGAQLSCILQNRKEYEYYYQKVILSPRQQQYLSILIMHKIARNFTAQKPYMTDITLSKELKLSIPLTREMLILLQNIGLIIKIFNPNNQEQGYLPSMDVHQITLYDIINRLTLSTRSSIEVMYGNDKTTLTPIFENFDNELQQSSTNQPLLTLNLS